ncbi:MAG: DUF535 family protein [Prolixibacteraceae bacterium]|nr:DUF535 family protein [Prolixibacteraceae bacterium]
MEKLHPQSNHSGKNIPFISIALKSRELASQAFSNETRKYQKKQERKYFFHSIMNPSFSSWWFELLENPDFKFVTKYRPKLYFKPFRVYLSSKWNNKRKVKVITDTYQFILASNHFTRVITDPPIEIAKFQLKDGIEAFLKLGYDFKYRKEGELVLSFECEALGGIIAETAFSFEELEPQQWACRIGCIQGHHKNDLYSAKAAQKMMHGLRPKSLIVFAVQEFSRALGFRAIYGSGDSIQAYRKKHFIHIPFLHNIPFDYDAFWEESEGKQGKQGWYELPLVTSRKDIQDIKSSKRALYRRRYDLMDDISLKIKETAKELLS